VLSFLKNVSFHQLRQLSIVSRNNSVEKKNLVQYGDHQELWNLKGFQRYGEMASTTNTLQKLPGDHSDQLTSITALLFLLITKSDFPGKQGKWGSCTFSFCFYWRAKEGCTQRGPQKGQPQGSCPFYSTELKSV
jgi:hypothetical protein